VVADEHAVEPAPGQVHKNVEASQPTPAPSVQLKLKLIVALELGDEGAVIVIVGFCRSQT
jgi:hypothetical protein